LSYGTPNLCICSIITKIGKINNNIVKFNYIFDEFIQKTLSLNRFRVKIAFISYVLPPGSPYGHSFSEKNIVNSLGLIIALTSNTMSVDFF